MVFATVSKIADPNEPARIAANVAVGMGFIGAGIIMHDKQGSVHGLTTAATLWLTAAIGLAIGYEDYLVAVIAMIAAYAILKLPHIGEKRENVPHLANQTDASDIKGYASKAATKKPNKK